MRLIESLTAPNHLSMNAFIQFRIALLSKKFFSPYKDRITHLQGLVCAKYQSVFIDVAGNGVYGFKGTYF